MQTQASGKPRPFFLKIDHKDMETIESFKSIYQAYLESNLTVRDFCKKLEIPEGRFYYWQKRIRDEVARSNGEFMPVSINNHAGKVVLVGNGRQQQLRHQHGVVQPSCEIVFPNGVTVRLSGEIAASTLGQLIMMSR